MPDVRFLLWAAPAASLYATASIVWFASLAPRLDSLAFPALLGEAAEYALLAWASCAAITLALCVAIPKPAGFDALRCALCTAAAAVWLAPLMILLSAFSLGALAAGLVLVAAITRLLHSHWRLIYGYRETTLRLAPPAPGLIVSCALQAGLLAVPLGHPLTAAALFAIATAALTLFATLVGAWPGDRPASLPRSLLELILALSLATALTLTGLSPHLQVNPEARWDHTGDERPGVLASGRALLASVLYGERPGPHETPVPANPPPAAGGFSDNTFPGVILWPEVKPHTMLVAPLPAFGRGLLNLSPVNPLSIPFAGEYWMFKPPYARPPLQSLTRRGSPLDLSFFTTDHVPMFMEAHHRFDTLIDLRCCARIQLVISNLDSWWGTVALELILLNSKSKPQSLGTVKVMSRPQGRPGRGFTATQEILDYPVPPASALNEFDEIKIVFHRDKIRNDRSAKIAIESFRLVPR